MRPQFVEDMNGELGIDLEEALRSAGVFNDKNQRALEQWKTTPGHSTHESRVRLLSTLPPDQQYGFAVRTLCTNPRRVKELITNSIEENIWVARHFAMAIGAVDQPLEGENVRMPNDRDRTNDGAKLFEERTMERVGRNDFERSRHLLEKISTHAIKHEEQGSDTQTRAIAVRRAMFHTNLMQALVVAGHSAESLQPTIKIATARNLFTRKLGTQNKPTPATTERALRLVPIERAKQLAQKYIELYQGNTDSRFNKTAAVTLLSRMRRVEDTVHDAISSETETVFVSLARLLARMCGIRDLSQDNSLLDPGSQPYKDLREWLDRYELLEHHSTPDVARDIYITDAVHRAARSVVDDIESISSIRNNATK